MLNDQLQVPSLFFVTEPIDAVSVTTSSPGSLQVPVFAAVAPSLTVTVALLRAALGATLFTTRLNVVVETAPSLSVAVIVTA